MEDGRSAADDATPEAARGDEGRAGRHAEAGRPRLGRPIEDGAEHKQDVFHRGPPNDRLVDFWSATHLAWGLVLALFMDPWLAFGLLVLWEPLEVLVLSPLVAKVGVSFGHESLRNSMSDIVFDAIGVAIGYWAVRPLVPWGA